ncbi:hypothetical protein [Bradyrhizobium valentinum]|uniref:ATP dependent DNA ligase n=1 Tax=Bradyrhizobium valentinum TaxID=1518501 RepID=UPI0030B826EE
MSILSLTVKTKPQTRRSAHHPEGGRKTSLTTKPIRKPKATWVKPTFVADVEYRDITSEGLLRASSFKGLYRK